MNGLPSCRRSHERRLLRDAQILHRILELLLITILTSLALFFALRPIVVLIWRLILKLELPPHVPLANPQQTTAERVNSPDRI